MNSQPPSVSSSFATSATLLARVRCVRGGASGSGLVVSADGLSVRDTGTGLVWQRYMDTGARYSQAGASAFCASLDLGPMSGFRLPTVAELLTIVDETRSNPPIDSAAFPGNVNVAHWTSTPDASNASNAWTINFVSNGVSGRPATTSTNAVRCVR